MFASAGIRRNLLSCRVSGVPRWQLETMNGPEFLRHAVLVLDSRRSESLFTQKAYNKLSDMWYNALLLIYLVTTQQQKKETCIFMRRLALFVCTVMTDQPANAVQQDKRRYAYNY
jgi:hypothetical protein